jgi:AbrB family looped-hinge helix DNA binding protein
LNEKSDKSTHSATVRSKSQLTLPAEVRQALRVGEGDEVEFTVTEDGGVVLRGLTKIPTDQMWFWQKDWQDGEREATAEIGAGQTTTYGDADAMFADLDR